MAALRATGARLIWCDHHKTAAEYGYDDLEGVRDFSDKGLSGAELAWLHFFPDAPTPEAVRLVGDYDSWRLKLVPECLWFRSGIETVPNDANAAIWDNLLTDDWTVARDTTKLLLDNGRVICDYREREGEGLCQHMGYETEIDGVRAFALNAPRFGSRDFGERMKAFPICITYRHHGDGFTVSLYSETLDVSEVAKRHGGGGHKGAAGFTCETLPFRKKT